MTDAQERRAVDVAERCRLAAERAVVDTDRVRWSAAAERLEQALKSRGYPQGMRAREFFDQALERLIEEIHAIAP